MLCCGSGLRLFDRSVEAHRCPFCNDHEPMAYCAGNGGVNCPRSCPSSGAAARTYQRWFRHGSMQEHVLGGGLHAHARSSSRAHQLLRFRLGCHGLPCVVGRPTGTPRHLRRCACGRQELWDEKHLVLECIALVLIRLRFQHQFQHVCTMSSFMK
jgi:hypothetical protein